MSKLIVVVLLAVSVAVLPAEVPPFKLEKHATFNPELKTETIETHSIYNKDTKSEFEKRPVYKVTENKNEGRARIEPVRPQGPVVNYDRMLSDQPSPTSTEVNRIDNLAIPNYSYGPAEVAYPDIPYAPGYGYENGYLSNGYDMYGNSLSNYATEPDTSTFGLLWSQVPDSRTIVSYAGRTILWIFNSLFVLFIGSLLTIGVCAYTNLCTITFNGVGPIHEEMRAFITPERLERISHAADFVKNAIDKYQKIQKVTDTNGSRSRRAVYYRR